MNHLLLLLLFFIMIIFITIQYNKESFRAEHPIVNFIRYLSNTKIETDTDIITKNLISQGFITNPDIIAKYSDTPTIITEPIKYNVSGETVSRSGETVSRSGETVSTRHPVTTQTFKQYSSGSVRNDGSVGGTKGKVTFTTISVPTRNMNDISYGVGGSIGGSVDEKGIVGGDTGTVLFPDILHGEVEYINGEFVVIGEDNYSRRTIRRSARLSGINYDPYATTPFPVNNVSTPAPINPTFSSTTDAPLPVTTTTFMPVFTQPPTLPPTTTTTTTRPPTTTTTTTTTRPPTTTTTRPTTRPPTTTTTTTTTRPPTTTTQPPTTTTPDPALTYTINNQADMNFDKQIAYTTFIIEYELIRIPDYMFYGLSNLTTVQLPDTVTTIGTGAFDGCKRLTNINLPDNLTQIGENSFSFCESLTSITLPVTLTQIGQMAFYGCTNLASINIPGSVISIGAYAFYATPLESCGISISTNNSNVQYTVENDTCSQYQLTTPDLYLDTAALSAYVINTNKDKSKTNIIISDGVETIPNDGFSYNIWITSIVFPDGLISIGSNAFYGCTGLTSIVLPSTVTTISSDAFNMGICDIKPNNNTIKYIADGNNSCATWFV
jgi:hypothetical protein